MSVTRGAGNGHKELGLRPDAGVVQRRAFGAPAVGVAVRRNTAEAAHRMQVPHIVVRQTTGLLIRISAHESMRRIRRPTYGKKMAVSFIHTPEYVLNRAVGSEICQYSVERTKFPSTWHIV